MIVTCPDCDTSFQLDESRIPQKGIRVRCSRCKHAFHLAHPSASQSEAIEAVAAEAVTGGGTSAPSVTQDLIDPNATSSSAAMREEINNEDAAEWEFNEDIPSTDGEREPEREPEPELAVDAEQDEACFGGDTSADEDADLDVDESAGGLDLADDGEASGLDLADDGEASGLDLAADPGQPPAAAAAAAPVAEVAPETASAEAATGDADPAQAFGSVDDFSSLMDDDPLDAIAAPQADHTADELRAQAAAQDTSYKDDGQVDDLGDPEKWDFFDGAQPAAATPPPSTAIGRIALQPAGSATEELAKDWQAAPVVDPTKPGLVARLADSAGRIVGWTVVIVGFALGLVSGLWTTAESFVAGERTTPIGSLAAVDMHARWVDTARAGRLLVVSGGLHNPTSQPVAMPGPVEIALLDRLGDRLALPPVSAGVVLSERQLRELPKAVLTRVRGQAARELQSLRVPAGKMLPFQVLIFDAPTSGLRFEARLSESGTLSLPDPMLDEPGIDAQAAAEGRGTAASPPSSEVASGVALDGATAPAPAKVAPAAPGPAATGSSGYDDPYGDDAGMGLQDL